jgi:lipopolysaccharide export system ATP-binding protein
MLTLDSVHFSYGRQTILRGAYLALQSGQIVGLFGRNGSGKSTLLRIAVGDLSPDNGHVSIDGHVFRRPERSQRFGSLAYLSQATFLPADLRVRQLVKDWPTPVAGLDGDSPLSLIHGSKVRNLSAGERRYLEICLLLALDRPYLLLDEPFSGMAPTIVQHIADLLMDASKAGTGILIVDQCLREVTAVADTAYVLSGGRCTNLDTRDGSAILSELRYS